MKIAHAMRFGVPCAGSDTGDPPRLTDAGTNGTDAGTNGDVPPRRSSPDVGDDTNAGKRLRQHAEANFLINSELAAMPWNAPLLLHTDTEYPTRAIPRRTIARLQ